MLIWLKNLFNLKNKSLFHFNIKKANEIPVEVDLRLQNLRRRLNEEYDKHEKCILIRSLKPHSKQCRNEMFCENDPCFIYQPDKIVSEPYIVEIKKPHQ